MSNSNKIKIENSKKNNNKAKDSKNPKEAVVLLNMGGPNNLFEVEVFLKNMFNDPLILTIKNSFIRKMVASMIVNSRIKIATNNYKHIGSKSPIVELTFNLIKKLQELDSMRFYTYAMRYTPPFSDFVIKELKEKNIDKITLFSMYPQYSNTTTLSSVRDFLQAAQRENYNPDIKIVENYPTDEGYINSCVEQIKKTNEDFSDFILFLSAHSIPKSMIDAGDLYEKEIKQSIEALKSALINNNIYFKEIQLTYQSKIGPIKWLEPNTIDMIKKYKNHNLMIFPIAFSIDNSETYYELEIENRHLAQTLGVKKYVVCKCLNDSTTFAKAIINLINLKGKNINEAKI